MALRNLARRTRGGKRGRETNDASSRGNSGANASAEKTFRPNQCRTASRRTRDCRSYIHGYAKSDAQSFAPNRERRAAMFHCSDALRSQPAIEGAGSGTDGRDRRNHAAANKRDKIHCWQRTRRNHREDRDGAICVLNMNWVRAHYEKALFVGAALLLFLSSIFIWRNAARFGSTLAGVPPAPSLKSASPLAKAEELAAAAAKLRQPPQWTFGGRSGLFVPEKHFIGANGLPATLQTTEVHPPVPNEWLEQFGLPIAEADVLTQDPDGDGFNNLEEWQNHTNPTDKNSHPPFIAKLKMKSFTQEPFRLVFASWVDHTFAINTNDLKEPTQFLRLGD